MNRKCGGRKRGRNIACFAILAAVLGFGAAGCDGGRTPLLLYSPHGRDLLALVETTYEELNPTIDVRWLDMGSQDVYDRVRSEAANPQADVWFGGPDTIFSRGAAEGLLAPFRPTWADHLPPASRHPDDLYFGLYEAVPILIYNSDAVTAAEAPSDWDDLLKPRWRDTIIIRDPLASGTMRTAFGMVVAQSVAETGDTAAGFEWLLQLDGQTKEYVVNPALLFEKLTRQEGLVSIWELTDLLFLQQRGTPLGYHFPTSGTPVITDSIGLVAGTPHAEEAKRFIEWIGSREALQLTAREAFRLPARTDMPRDELPEWAQEALREMVRAEVDWDLIAEHGTEWMSRWDREVRSRG
ncbi:MAG: extracellular solute-binding protein [Acidobacteria bacterium]|nr:MAG: extracellular solute-binding protein [Acidobacteriota bacterium]